MPVKFATTLPTYDIPSKWSIIPIHASDRETFKYCRRQWAWSSPSRLNLAPKVAVHGIREPLWFGTGIHHALERYYTPLREDPVVAWETWFNLQWNGGLVTVDELHEFEDRDPTYDAERNAYFVRGLDELLPTPDEEHFMELLDLGKGMMKYYKEYAEANDDFTVIATEHSFSVPVLDKDGYPLYMHDARLMPDGWEPDFSKENAFGPLIRERTEKTEVFGIVTYDVEKQVHARGRMDLILQDNESGRYGIKDYKAQPLDELVLTPTGFVRMGNLSIGDEVIGSSGKAIKVTGIFPCEGFVDTYRVWFKDGSHVDCSVDHYWTVFNRDNAFYHKPKPRTLAEIQKLSFTWSVPICEPIEFAENFVKLIIDPYLLGLLLGDGYLAGTGVELSCSEPEIIKNVIGLLPPGIEIVKLHEENYSWRICHERSQTEISGMTVTKSRHASGVNTILKEIQRMGLHGKKSLDKFIPEIYLHSSINERVALLQGLMDADGNVYNGVTTFRTCSQQLRDDIIYLVRSLGGTARFNRNDGTNHPSYRVHIRMPNNINPFRLTRKANTYNIGKSSRPLSRYIDRIEQTNELTKMQCISVDAEDGLYITRDFVLTHNTAGTIGEDYFRHLDLDEQCTTYLTLGEVEAVIYDLPYKELDFISYEALLKGYPKPPTITSKGFPSIDRQKETTTAKLFEETIAKLGIGIIFERDPKMQSYYQWLLETDDKRFVNRTDKWRNKWQRINARIRLYYEAKDMLSPDLVAYPAPRKEYKCLNCIFRTPCLQAEDGSDYGTTLEYGYESNWDR